VRDDMQTRKNYFIKKKFQLNFLLKFVILLLIESFLIAGLFMYVSNDTITTGYLNSTLRIEKTPDFFFVSLLLIVLIVVIGIGIAAMVIFLLLSHRIAGPLYRFEKTLKEAEGGDLTARIDLRKTDELTKLKESINSAFGSMDSRFGRIKKGLFELEELLSKPDDPQAVSKARSKINMIKDEIGYFKVSQFQKSR